jgi:LPS-assembly protein
LTPFAALSAAALLAGLSATPPAPLAGATGDVTFEAKQVVFDGATGTYQLDGDAMVRRGGVVLRARHAKLNPTTGEVWASGGALLLDATRAVQAETLHAVLDGPFEASDVVAYLKEKPFDPVKITSLSEARPGRNKLTLSAEEVDGDAEGRLRIRGPRVTLCDCGVGKAPTWELAAPHAEVEGDRLSLSWPVLRVTPRFVGVQHPVPVLVLPWLSLPLRDRQSGLLFPELSSHPITGFAVGLPVYFTLGRSADATVTPQWYFGPANSHNPGGAVAGPGLGLELRWAPAEQAAGVVRFHLVDDREREHLLSGEPGASGLRLSIEGEHQQDLGPSNRLVSHLQLAQDAFLFRDFRGDNLPGDPFYSRSDVLFSHRAERWVLEGGAAYLEPLVHADRVRPGPPSWFGLALPALQRWPSASAVLLPSSSGGLELQGRVGVSRFAPFVGHTGPLLPTDPGSPEPDPVTGLPSRQLPPGTVALPREAVTRGEARLQLSYPVLLGRSVSLEPWIRGVASEYAFDAAPSTTAAWGVGGLTLSTELARKYGTVEHRLAPRLEVLGGTAVWRPAGAGPFPAYDVWDRTEPERPATVDGAPAVIVQQLSAAPSGDYGQLRFVLGNRLSGKRGTLALDVGQDADIRRGKLAESFVALNAARGPFSADADVRFLAFGGGPPLTPGWQPSWLDGFTRLHVGAGVHDARGDALRFSLDSTGPGAVGRQNAGVDALFDLRSAGVPPDAWWRGGARVVLGGASLEYAIRLTAREYPNLQCTNGTVTTNHLDAGRPYEQTGVLAWDSPCHCFVARLRATRDACDNMTYGFDLDLSKMLQVGAATHP